MNRILKYCRLKSRSSFVLRVDIHRDHYRSSNIYNTHLATLNHIPYHSLLMGIPYYFVSMCPSDLCRLCSFSTFSWYSLYDVRETLNTFLSLNPRTLLYILLQQLLSETNLFSNGNVILILN